MNSLASGSDGLVAALSWIVQNSLLDAEGVRLSVRESGRVDAPAVVLVHGWGRSGEVWAAGSSFRAYAPDLRGEVFRCDVGSAAVLEAVDKPTLVVHGTADEVVDPAAGEYAAALIPGADLRRYERTGHAPFLEHPERFAADLAGFVAEVAR